MTNEMELIAMEMSDQQMIKLAAKAAGIEGLWSDRGQCIVINNCAGLSMHHWRPLEDDGDAFRLAVKLGFDIWLVDGTVSAGVVDGNLFDVSMPNEPLGKDPFASTRRIIVRAAAEIGKTRR